MTDDVSSRIVYVAGTDKHDRPTVVMCGCELPDPRTADWDAINDQWIQRLRGVVEEEYALVLFLGGMAHRPSLRMLAGVYRRLDRSFKKNLKRIHIVKPSAWTNLLLGAMLRLMSPKAKRKWAVHPSLDFLREDFGREALRLPLSVVTANASGEDEAEVDGVDGSTAPALAPRVWEEIYRDNIRKLQPFAASTEGLFRKSVASTALQSYVAHYAHGSDAARTRFYTLADEPRFADEPHLYACAVKRSLREMRWGAREVRDPANGALLPLLREVARNEAAGTRMDSRSLALCFAPNAILGGPEAGDGIKPAPPASSPQGLCAEMDAVARSAQLWQRLIDSA